MTTTGTRLLGKQAMGIWAQAQVHATLAQVGATLEGRMTVNYGDNSHYAYPDSREWTEALS